MFTKSLTSALSMLVCVLSAHLSLAQDAAISQSQTLNEQYNTLVDKSQTYNEYKVIKQHELTDFWKVVGDSVTEVNTAKQEALATIATKQAQIESLNNTILQKEQDLASGEEEKANITVLGAEISKSSYAIISLIIPFILLVIIAFLAVKSKVDGTATKTAKQDFSGLQEEYEAYKKRALDLQTKLNRELQTERNKLSELKR
jgi:ATP-dependent Zn protease